MDTSEAQHSRPSAEVEATGTSAGGELGPTGDQVVDEALESLDSLDGRPLREHVTAFEAVHGALQDRLAEGQR